MVGATKPAKDERKILQCLVNALLPRYPQAGIAHHDSGICILCLGREMTLFCLTSQARCLTACAAGL